MESHNYSWILLYIVLVLCSPLSLGSDEDNYDYYYGGSGEYYYYSGDYQYTPPPPTPPPLCPGLRDNYDLCSLWYYGDRKLSK